jgi:hypothetical protein
MLWAYGKLRVPSSSMCLEVYLGPLKKEVCLGLKKVCWVMLSTSMCLEVYLGLKWHYYRLEGAVLCQVHQGPSIYELSISYLNI